LRSQTLMKPYFCILLVISVFFISCKKTNRFALSGNEINNVGTKVHIHRFDSALIMLDTTDMKQSVGKLYADFPKFTTSFIINILGENPADTANVVALLQDFLSDTTFQSINKKTLATYRNISVLEKDLTTAFGFLNYYFPKINTPEIYFFVSGFNRSILLDKNMAGVGVDLYLGSDEPVYEYIVYEYMTPRMRPECVVPEIITAILYEAFPPDDKVYRLLDNMLYHGKIMYLLSAALPAAKPNDLIAYTKFQWEWSRKYEREIWESIATQQYLYSSDISLIRKFIGEAPFTTPVSQESPGRLGIWVGWQIINSYMGKNKEITLPELMNESDFQKILEKAGYHP